MSYLGESWPLLVQLSPGPTPAVQPYHIQGHINITVAPIELAGRFLHGIFDLPYSAADKKHNSSLESACDETPPSGGHAWIANAGGLYSWIFHLA